MERNSSSDTLSGITINVDNPNKRGRQYRLLNCRINVDADVFESEHVPVTTSAVANTTDATQDDLYFMRWVLRGLFGKLRHELDTNHPGYSVLRCEAEPGISWDDFRHDKRGLLIWLAREQQQQQQPVDLMVAALNQLEQEPLPRLVANVKQELDKAMQQLTKLEQRALIISNAGNSGASTEGRVDPAAVHEGSAGNNAQQQQHLSSQDEWSVVEESESDVDDDGRDGLVDEMSSAVESDSLSGV